VLLDKRGTLSKGWTTSVGLEGRGTSIYISIETRDESLVVS